MKKLLLGLLVLGGVGFLAMRRDLDRKIKPTPLPSPALLPTASTSVLGLVVNEDKLQLLSIDGRTYRTAWSLVTEIDSIRVGVNEGLASSSSTIYETEKCTVLTSGGFYGKNELPIGMVVAERKLLSPWQDNQLFNAVLGWDGTSLSIQQHEGQDYIWAIQAGPLLYQNGQPKNLELKHDQPARRMVAGVTQEGQLLLAVIVAQDGLFDGPLLVNLPTIMQQLGKMAGVTLVSALNLDGGTASAFVSQGVTVRELKPIGSWICAQ